MGTEVQLAVAGSGKTTELARRITDQPGGVRSAALTFTTNAQAEIISRLPNRLRSQHETMGWFAFLVRHIVRPYLPKVFPGIYATGLCFVQTESEIPRGRSGWRRYFNDQHHPYSVRLALLAKKVLEANRGAPIRRLEKIYHNIYIDEFQDLVGNDLVVLEALMKSKMELFITGDVRQAVLATSSSDRLNQDYRGTALVNWFREKESEGLCRIVPNDVTNRFNQSIADFSDLIHDPALKLPATTSEQRENSGHDGIFLIDESHLDEYFASLDSSPTLLWSRRSARELPEGELLTFGSSKGITRNRVIILTTRPIQDWLTARTLLAPKSASGFYVAVTRARYSAALVTQNAERLYNRLHTDFSGKIELWAP